MAIIISHPLDEKKEDVKGGGDVATKTGPCIRSHDPSGRSLVPYIHPT
jgi:hypothetical protein